MIGIVSSRKDFDRLEDDRMDPHAGNVAAAVDELYEAFSRHALKPGLEDRCSPVVERRELARALCGERLRSLPVDALAQYACTSLSTLGNEEDLKHFLPRVLEVHAIEPGWDRECTHIFFAKMRQLAWEGWSSPEPRALVRYLTALWHDILASFPGTLSVTMFLSDLDTLGLDVRPFLAVWRPRDSVCALRRAAELVNDLSSDHRLQELQHTKPEIEEWLTSNSVEAELERAFFQHDGEPWADELTIAADRLHWVRWPR